MNTDNKLSDLDPKEITTHLTKATRLLDVRTATTLHRARNRALKKQLTPQSVLALSSGHSHHFLPHSAPQWFTLSIFVLVILVGSINYWHDSSNQVSSSPLEIASVHLDIAILTDDLPMEVFID